MDRSDPYEEAFLIQRAIYRNFGGLNGAARRMGKIFSKKHKMKDIWHDLPTPKVLDLINLNLQDEHARYLMLITQGNLGSFILDKYLNISEYNRRMLVGSSLEQDLNQEQYGFRSLSDVILYAEKGISVIFKDMDHIYSSLYNLFNQSFSVFGDRRYCRIALGAYFNPKCFIHKDFHAIVLMNDDDNSIAKADAPFLNRFEKHYFRLNDILNETQKYVLETLHEWIDLIMSPSEPDQTILLNANNIFPIYSEESLAVLVLHNCRDIENSDFIVDKCKDLLLQSASADILILTQISKLNAQDALLIRERWRQIHVIDFRNLIQSLIREVPMNDCNKVFVYTYHKEILTKIFNSNLDEKIVHNNFSSFKSEQDLRRNMLSFFNDSIHSVYLLELDYCREGAHLYILKFLVDKLESETRYTWTFLKSIVVVVRMARNIVYEPIQNMFEGWDYWMFNELLPSRVAFDENFLRKSTIQLIVREELETIEHYIATNIEKCLLKFRYEATIYNQDKRSLNDYIYAIIQNLAKDQQIRVQIKRKIIKSLNEGVVRMKDWKKLIFCDPSIILNSVDLHSSIITAINRELDSVYTVILFLLENNCALNSYFTYYDQPCGDILREIWTSCFENLTTHNIRLQIMNQSNLAKFGVEFTFPFIGLDFNNIYSIYNQYIQDTVNLKYVGDPEEAFVYSFREKTMLKDKIIRLKESKELQELYFQNLIKFQISENLLDFKYEELYYSLFAIVCDNSIEFENKLLILLKYEKLFILTISLIESYQPFCGSDFVDGIISKLNLVKLDPGLKAKKPKWMKELSSIYQSIISDIVPRSSILDKAGGIAVYASIIEKMHNLLLSLRYEQNIPIDNIDTINFWLQFCTLISKLNLSRDFLHNIIDVQYADELNGELILNTAFSKHIVAIVNSLPNSETNIHILKFTSAYLSLLVKYNPDWMICIAEYIEQTELWRYSNYLVDTIIEQSKLNKQLRQLYYSLEGSDSEELWIENAYIIKLESILDMFGLDCKLAILISDKLIKYFNYHEQKYDDIEDQMKNNLALSMPLFDYFTDLINQEGNKLRSIRKLLSIIILRKSYDVYSYILSHNFKLKRLQDKALNKYNRYLIEGPYSELLSVYCVKRIKQIQNITTEDTFKFLSSKSGIDWIQEFIASQDTCELKIFPIVPSLVGKYSTFALSLKRLLNEDKNLDVIDRYIIESRTPEDRLIIGLGFQNIVLNSYLEQPYSNASRWYNAKKALLIQHLGRELTCLISNFILNFPVDSILRICPENARYLTQINTICFVLNVVMSYNKVQSPITSIFFNSEGSVGPDFRTRFNSLFIITSESNPMLDDLKFKLDNYDSLKSKTWSKSYSKGGSYKCSDTCDYLYFIDNCGGATVVSKCPYCRSDIGGTGHSMIQRPGHQNLSDAEAIAFLKDRISKHERKSERGYNKIGEDTPYVRNLKPITYRILHLILNTVLYFLKISNLVSKQDMKQILTVPNDNYEGSFSRAIYKDLETISVLLDSDDSYIWSYNVISLLPEFISNNKIIPTSYKIRNRFEKEFEDVILKPCLESVTNIITNYKQPFLSKEARQSFRMATIEEIQSPEYNENRLIKLFRLIREPSFDNMVNTFNMSSLSDSYPILDIYFKNSQGFNKLRSLYPILELTNYLLKEYNHTITRQFARETPMNKLISKDKVLRRLYKAFLEAWNSAEFYDLQYECKQLKAVQFDKESSLIYFLVDNKEEGGGMYMAAALLNLASIQNSLLSSLVTSLATTRMLKEKHIIDQQIYTIQSIKSKNVLCPILDNHNLIEICSLNNCLYGNGKEVIYDYDRLQNHLIQQFLNAKFLDIMKLDLIQYQFEFLNSNSNQSGIISDIRSLIPQNELDRTISSKLEEFMREIERKEKGRFNIVLNEIYSSLSNILCYLKTAGRNPHETLCSFSNRIKSSRLSIYLTEANILSNLSLMYIVALYEYIEEKYFPNILKYVKTEFTSHERADEIRIKVECLVDQCRKSDQLPTINMIRNAMIRFVSRFLTADLDPNLPMKMYLMNRDFWNVSITDEVLDNLESVLTDDILLSDSISFYDTLNTFMQVNP